MLRITLYKNIYRLLSRLRLRLSELNPLDVFTEDLTQAQPPAHIGLFCF